MRRRQGKIGIEGGRQSPVAEIRAGISACCDFAEFEMANLSALMGDYPDGVDVIARFIDSDQF